MGCRLDLNQGWGVMVVFFFGEMTEPVMVIQAIKLFMSNYTNQFVHFFKTLPKSIIVIC